MISGSRMRALSLAIRRSHSNARSKLPPITQPLSAAIIGTGSVKNACVPLCPRSMNAKSLMSSVRTPSCEVSRPDENDAPSPRQITARSPGRSCSSARIANRRWSIASFAALCFSGLS
jgi:hypothetical protein